MVFFKGVIKLKALPYLPEHNESVAMSQAGRRVVGESRRGGKNPKS